MRLALLLFLAYITQIVSCTPDTESKVSDESTMTHVESFDRIDLPRYPLPINRADSLHNIEMDASEYLSKKADYDSLIYKIESDTILPKLVKDRQLYELKVKLGILKDLAYIQKLETICGDADNTEDVEAYRPRFGIGYDFVKEKSKSVAMIKWNTGLSQRFSGIGDRPGDVEGQNWGSAVLISDDMILTAAHSFEPNVNGWNTPVKNGLLLGSGEIAKLMHVIFHYQNIGISRALSGDTLSFPILELLEFRKNGFDFAVARLGRDRFGRKPGQTIQPLRLVPSTYKNSDDTLLIVQHPSGKPKRVDLGRLYYTDDLFLYYNEIDTEGGSSGSPVINFSSGLIEGIHVAGGCSRMTGSNIALKAQVIFKNSKYLKLN